MLLMIISSFLAFDGGVRREEMTFTGICLPVSPLNHPRHAPPCYPLEEKLNGLT
jgi:hypothetical protein